MVRFLVRTLLAIIANALGLFVTSLIVDGFSLELSGFLNAVVVFSICMVVLGPLMVSIALRSMPAVMGGVALLTTFVSLLITTIITDGLTIHGFSDWVVSTLIVWLFSLIAIVVLPLFMFKSILKPEQKKVETKPTDTTD